MTKVCIIGAGMAGLACGTALARAGHKATLYDKGRGPGGRMASRRVEFGGQIRRFDHGAQYFTAREPAFASQVDEWALAGVVSRWPAAGKDAWVGTPAMNAPIRAMAEPLEVAWGERVVSLEPSSGGWRVDRGEGAAAFELVVLAIPAEQAAHLLAPHHEAFAQRASRTLSRPCWALMAQFAERLPLGDTLRGSEGEPVAWAARNGAKPGRDGSESWVVHASPAWSRAHLELEPAHAGHLLLDAFAQQVGIALPERLHCAAHRWRFALAEPVEGPPALWDPAMRLGVAGDWLIAPRVEAAWLSGTKLAESILATHRSL